MDDLTREFLIESQEGLDRMERCLTELEERPQDKELLGEIFRSVHTIKGTTGFLGFKRLEKLAHAGENLLGLLRDGKVTRRRCRDHRRCCICWTACAPLLKTIEAEGSEGDGDDSALIARLEELQAPAQPPRPGAAAGRTPLARSGSRSRPACPSRSRRRPSRRRPALPLRLRPPLRNATQAPEPAEAAADAGAADAR